MSHQDDPVVISEESNLVGGDQTIKKTTTTLSFYHELDHWQKDNHYILSGYVKETNSYKKCLASLTYIHNETVNIYTHLLPCSLVLAAVLYYIEYYLPIYPTYIGWEKFNFAQFAIAVTVCFGASASFHTIKSHSQKICKFGNQLDYFGIIILITCSLISIVLFAFYDDSFYWKQIFITTFLTLGTICTVLTLDPRFATPEYRPLRSLMFIIFGLSGLFPVVVAINKYGYHVAVTRSNAHWLVAEGGFYITGAVLYAMRVPERFDFSDGEGRSKVGRFDIYFHSHQIFHVMVVIAAFCHWKALVGCYKYLHEVILNESSY
ncbi:ADIPOR-like receptor Izh1p [[Candida] railenensis]|uniref:ADIPOR-like receptor Izh1p n=1 Tax=[Candida] railenensis TaxID=45579 RepID=A0A9P0VV92_9ASCO|nr:ADIPOR-like receptor Izh1p [[Candida] railenensis]